MLRSALTLSAILHLVVMLGWHVADISRLPDGSTTHQRAGVEARLIAPGQETGKLSRMPPEKSVRKHAARMNAHAASTPPVAVVASTGVSASPGEYSSHPASAVNEVKAERSELPTSEHESQNIEGMRQYRLAIAREARRYKSYPAIARERQWQGVVVIQVSSAGVAGLPGVTLLKSSGVDVLDIQAVEMATRAVSSAPLPESLQGRSFVLSLPVRYALDD